MVTRDVLRVALGQHHQGLAEHAEPDNGVVHGQCIKCRPGVRPERLAEPDLVVIEAGDDAVRHRHHALQRRRRRAPVGALQRVVGGQHRVGDGVAIGRVSDDLLVDQEERCDPARGRQGPVDADVRQVAARGHDRNRQLVDDDGVWIGDVAVIAGRLVETVSSHAIAAALALIGVARDRARFRADVQMVLDRRGLVSTIAHNFPLSLSWNIHASRLNRVPPGA